ncbi:hypothetical protein BG006_010219 [Podila minutissima]|uniref:PA14 domain-containing protein n=1 Tax=Podila minutissima TaxID=64525 RepID=A0A9P5SDL9_9FUNG|nr:hypothetical protein BG006_010219 [Podila minutissima]
MKTSRIQIKPRYDSSTQDELLSTSSSYLLRSIRGGYGDKDSQEEDNVDIDSLDVAILTPTDNNRLDPFDGPTFRTRHGQRPPQLYDNHDDNTSSSSSSSSNSQVYPSGARKGHAKSFSQLSSGVVTIKGSTSSDRYSPGLPISTNGRHSLEKSTDDHLLQVQQPEEGMQFTSPDYRKSMVASIHSDDIAMDFSNGASPISGRGSFFNADHQNHQYGNLLQEAALIIEQQSNQGRSIGMGSRTSLDGVASPTMRSTNESGYEAIAAMAPSRPNSGRTVYRTVQEVPPTQPLPPPPPEPEAPVAEAPNSSTKSIASKNTPGSNSNRSTLTRSDSRRFSAHGNQFSSQTSLSSVSKESTVSARSASGRGEGGDEDDEDGYPISNSNHRNKPRNEPKGISTSSTGGSLHKNHTLQRFPTAHSQLHGYDDYSTNSNNHTLAPLPITPSSNAHSYQHYNNQPRHHHDYRPGVVFEYYEGEWDWLPNFDEMRPQHVGIVGNFMIDEATERELFRPRFPLMHRGPSGHVAMSKETGNYAVRFTTNIDITQDGVYSFWVSSNDGSVLYIANTLVVENDGMHYATEVEGRILLSAGKHPMTVEFFHRNGKMLEGFRSTGPSLVVSYRAPGPVWSFGLGAGPKQTMKSASFFYDHGDGRLMGLLNEYGVFDEYAEGGGKDAPESRGQDVGKVKGKAALWSQGAKDGRSSHAGGGGGGGSAERPHEWIGNQGSRPTRHRVMSGDMAQLQPSARELQVQMENAKTTIKDLEQIISDQAESHRNKMTQLYEILQDTQDQVDRLVAGLQKATLFEKPRTTIVQNRHNNNINGNLNKGGPLPSSLINRGHSRRPNNNINSTVGSNWRGTVVSVYVDAEEEHQEEEEEEGSGSEMEGGGEDRATNGDEVLKKHLADLEKLKQMYFFSMALSVKMNSEMMGKKTVEYTSTSVQRLYEECTVQNKVPVEGWPGFVSRYFAAKPGVGSLGLGGADPSHRSYQMSRPRSYSATPPSPPKPKFVSKDLVVSPDESGMRLDRFLLSRLASKGKGKDHPSSVNHVQIQKWFRKRQVKRVTLALDRSQGEGEGEGGESGMESRAVAVTVTAGATRTEAGQVWRVRLVEASFEQKSVEAEETVVEKKDTSLPLQDWVVYRDDRIIVLNKPAGVAVQGGTGVQSSVDSSLSVLKFENPERPKIVHRLDKTTSGLLVLARTRKAAQDLAKRFHDGSMGHGGKEGEAEIQKKVRG